MCVCAYLYFSMWFVELWFHAVGLFETEEWERVREREREREREH